MENLEQAANTEEVIETESEDLANLDVPEATPEVKDLTETQAFSRRLNEERAKIEAEVSNKTRDELIAEQYGESHGIFTYAQYKVAKAQAEEEAKSQALEEKTRAKYSHLDEEELERIIELEKNHEEYKRQQAETKKQQEEREAQEKQTERKQAEIKEFFELFKEENGRAWDEVDGLPKEVADLQAKGKSLPDAYNAYLKTTYKSKIGATEINEKNAKSSTGSVTGNGGTGTGEISQETFEAKKHDREWVIKNFSKITESRAKW